MSEHQARRRPTQAEIARAAGVSQATVSLVVNGARADGQVSAAKRERVLQAIRDLGYSVNPMARGLRGKGNRILGLYTFEPVFPVDEHDFYHPFLLGVEDAAAEQEYDLLLFTSAGGPGARSVYANETNRLLKADGCVLLGRHMAREDLARLAREDFPFVFIGRREYDKVTVPFVGADYTGATRDLMLKLAALGHTRFLLLKDTHGGEPSADREIGFRQGIAAAGLPPERAEVLSLDAPQELTARSLREVIDSGVSAILVEPNEDQSIGHALETAAIEAGVSIPGTCSVAFLGEGPASTATRIWAAFSLPRSEMGRRAVRMLVALLEGVPDVETEVLLECAPVDGNSIGLAPRLEGTA